MKKLALLLLALACIPFAQDSSAQTVTGQPIANQYQFHVAGFAPNTYTFTPGSCNVLGPQGVFAFAVGTPIQIVDGNPALTEVVTPTSVVNTNQTCAIAIAPLNNHQLPFYIQSATGGLQEAINANNSNPQSNTILLDNAWYQMVGGPTNAAAIIAAAKGTTRLNLQDLTQAPNTYYVWNGSQYVLTSVAGISLASYTTPGLQGGGKCYVYPSSITTDAFAAINACSSQLPAAGGTIDATALGTASYTVTTQLTALNQASPSAVTLLLNSGTSFIINTVFSSPSDSPASCAVPVGGSASAGSAIVVPGHNRFNGNFFAGPSFVGWDVVCSGHFDGTQESLLLDGVTVTAFAGAQIHGALIHLQGLFTPTRVTNSGTDQCFAQCLEVDSAAGGSSTATGNILFDNDLFTDGYSGSTVYPGSVVKIDSLTSAGELTNIMFLGGAIQDNGPHNQLLIINGRGSAQVGAMSFLNTYFETVPATTSSFNANVDPVQIVDAGQIIIDPMRVQGNTNSAAQANLIDISATTTNQNFGININQASAFTAAGFTCLIRNTIEGTCESGFTNAHGDTVLPNYTFGQVVPQIRQSNVSPPSSCAVAGSIWTNSTGTTPATTAFICAGPNPSSLTYQPFGGGGGSGSLGTLPNDTLTNNAGNTAAQDMYNFIATGTYAPQTAVNAAVTNAGTATLMPGSAGGFTNTANGGLGVKVQDLKNQGASLTSITEKGAWCDARSIFGTLNSSSTTLTISSNVLTTADVGKWIAAVGTVGGVPTAFETTIASVTDSLHAVLTTAAPFSVSGQQMPLGHDDTAAIASAVAASVIPQNNNGTPNTIPLVPAGNCLTHTIPYNGFSLVGLGKNSQLTFFPGEDGILAPDPSGGTSASGNSVAIGNFTAFIDNRIDATLPWQIINNSGTTAKTAVNRPGGLKSVFANNPLGPGWFEGAGPNNSGAIAGVGAINSGSPTLMTVPAGVTLPVATNTIVFPYLTTVFTTTVSSVNTGTRVVTLGGSYPGSTGTQIEWWAGTSVQKLGASYSGTGCPATMTLTNPITPNPSTETSVAAFGLIQVDSEQFTYYGKTNAGNLGSQFLTITGCAQNGTSRAAHSSSATVVPLNPFQPTTPWPVTPTINSNATTPTNAAFYPAWNVGNAFLAFPVSNGNAGLSGVGSFANSIISNIYINAYPAVAQINHTAEMYMVSLPYHTAFENIFQAGLYFGPMEGTPALNSGGNWNAAQPTADGTHWENVRINSCVGSDLISGGQNSFKDWEVQSQCQTPSLVATGAQACFLFTQGWNDQSGNPLSIQGSVDLHNMYCEPESGSLYGATPVFEEDISIANWDNLHMGGGGEFYLGGNNQHFGPGTFNNQALFPLINYGSGNSSDFVARLGWGNSVGNNTYGTNNLLNYGPNSAFSGATSQTNFQNSYSGPLQYLNSREPGHGQNNETFNLGNTTAPFVSTNGGYIPASEWNTNGMFEAQPFPIPWYYDPTSFSGGSVGCPIASAVGCLSFEFNQIGIGVGPGQRIAAGKYTMWLQVKSTGVASNFTLQLGICTPDDVASFTVPVTSSYSWFQAQVDLTGKGSCGGGIGLGFFYNGTADTISVGAADFAPVAQEPTFDNLDILTSLFLNGAAGTTGQVPTVQSDGTIKWGAGTGITALTGDVTATGPGSVAATVTRIGGGTALSGFTGLLQNTAGVVTQAQNFSLTGPGQVGTYLRSGVNTVTFSATPTFDASLGDTQLLTLTGDVSSSTLANAPAAGFTQMLRTIICQDGTGGHKFVYPAGWQGVTPVTQVANGCTPSLFVVTNTTVQAPNSNSENCISSASPAVCDQATGGEVAIPAGTNPTLQINTAAWGAHSQLIFTPDQTLGTDLGVTCNTLGATGHAETTGSSSGVDVVITWYGTIATNPLCGSFTVRNP